MPAQAIGGDEIHYHGGYRVHVYKSSSGTFEVQNGILKGVEYFILGGGGGGGNTTFSNASAGGGAGGLVHNQGMPINLNSSSYEVFVGRGGVGGVGGATDGSGENGGNSSFNNIVAIGGGGGGGRNSIHGKDGGCGGGSQSDKPGGVSISGQGYSGGYDVNDFNIGGGGGGGIGSRGYNANTLYGGNGGNGLSFNWTGISYYGGGGGGASQSGSIYQGSGGIGGGGNGSYNNTNSSTVNGVDFLGGGGGGGGNGFNLAGNGGSGLVMIRYPVETNLDDGLIMYYKMDETGVIKENSWDGTHPLTGMNTSGLSVVDGKFYNGVGFDSTYSGYLETSMPQQLVGDDAPLSISIWFSGDDKLMSIGTTVGFPIRNRINIRAVADGMQLETKNGSYTTSLKPNYSIGYNHFCLTYDGSNALDGFTLYLNGTGEQSTNISNFSMVDGPFVIGCFKFNDAPFFMNGNIDEFAVWTRELSSGEVVDQLWANGQGREFDILYGQVPKTVRIGNNTRIQGAVRLW